MSMSTHIDYLKLGEALVDQASRVLGGGNLRPNRELHVKQAADLIAAIHLSMLLEIGEIFVAQKKLRATADTHLQEPNQ